MKKALTLLTLTFLISCKEHHENHSYDQHIIQVDSIVSANRNIEDLKSLLSGY